MIPKDNEKDLTEIPNNIKQKLEIIPVQWIDEVLQVALVKMPEPLDEADIVDKIQSKGKKTTTKNKPAQAH
jgi:ATP-dependent Lon protease